MNRQTVKKTRVRVPILVRGKEPMLRSSIKPYHKVVINMVHEVRGEPKDGAKEFEQILN